MRAMRSWIHVMEATQGCSTRTIAGRESDVDANEVDPELAFPAI